MDGILLSVCMLVSTTGALPALAPPRAAVLPAILDFELPEGQPCDLRGDRLTVSAGPTRERRLVRSAQATTGKRSRTERIIAVAAGVSIGWVVGGGIGFAVTPKRGPHDDTSGLKGMMIGAPIGATAGALLGWRLTK